MELRIMCDLRFLEVSILKRSIKFPDASLVEGGEYLDSRFFSEYVLREVGNIALRRFIKSPYLRTKVQFQKIDPKTHATKTLFYKSRFYHYLNALWFIKDNSASIGTVIGFIPKPNSLFISINAPGFSNAKGSYESTIFNVKEFKRAIKIVNTISQIESGTPDVEVPFKIEFDKTNVIPSKYHYRDYNIHNRIERALSFLVMARSNDFLPLKIALYISVLECLFTTDVGELTHKISQRTAFYIGGTAAKKKRFFNIVRLSYEIRSKFFHGQQLVKNRDSRISLERASSDLDSLLRVVLNKVIFKDSKLFLSNNEKLNEYLSQLIFGKPNNS